MFWIPDFGLSDLWHQNFAFKFLYSSALKAGFLPFWSKDIGTGFPLLGEGQTGMFNLANLILFRFFDTVTAFNLSYLVFFATIFLGAFLYARIMKLSRLSAIYLGTITAFSGFYVTNIAHFNTLQSASFLPLEFFLTEKILQSKKLRWPIILGLILSQQIFAGHPHTVFISLFGVTGYAFLRIYSDRRFKKLFLFFGGLTLGAILSLPQLLPTLELTRQSVRQGGVGLSEMIRFPYPPIHLLSFFYPFLFGNPKFGTYPPFGADWGIFWESTGYFGLIPFLLVIWKIIDRTKKQPLFKISLVIGGVALILMLGKYTPVFFVFQLPPFSFFRVPARFIVLFVWALTVISALKFNEIKNYRWQLAILVLSAIDVLNFFVNYNTPLVSPKKWLSPPNTVLELQKDKGWFRIFSVPDPTAWNKVYLTSGWQSLKPYFEQRNSLQPDENLYWQIPEAGVYAGLLPERLNIWLSLVNSGFSGSQISSASAKLLGWSGVKYVIRDGQISSVSAFRPHAYLTRNYVLAGGTSEIIEKITDPQNDSVVLEQPVGFPSQKDSPTIAYVVSETDLSVRIDAVATASALLVLSDSFYPGWYAFIDGKPTKIYPANLNQRAVIFPAGEHEVIFHYEPFKNLLTNWHL